MITDSFTRKQRARNTLQRTQTTQTSRDRDDFMMGELSTTHYHYYWLHLPTDMIHMIASALDGRSLARFESVDEFTHSAIAQRSILLWRALADIVELKIEWMNAVERNQLNTFQRGERIKSLKEEHPKQYFLERRTLIRGFHHRLLAAQQNRLGAAPYKKRTLALRWYDEVILPTCLLIILTLFIIFLIYQLETKDGNVTWMTMSFLLIFCGLLTASFCVTCVIRCRNSPNDLPPLQEYDISHFIANNCVRESNSFISVVLDVIHPISSEHPFPRIQLINPATTHLQLILRFLLSSLIMISLFICMIFISLRVTGTVNWSWMFVFTPFFLAMGLLPFIACFPCTQLGQSTSNALLLLVLCSPLIVFLALLTVYLNNADGGGSSSSQPRSLKQIFFPLYLIDAGSLLFILILSSSHCCWQCCRDEDEDVDGEVDEHLLKHLVMLVQWIMFIGPFVYIKVILGLRSDGDMIVSNLALFLPLLLPVLMTIVIFVCSMQGICRSLRARSDEIDEESRRAAAEPKVPPTLEEMENDPRFVVAIVELLPPVANEVVLVHEDVA